MSQVSTIKCSHDLKAEISRIANTNGMTQTTTIEALVACFKAATPEQQREAIVNRVAIIDANADADPAEAGH